jgi:hypothetical protein
VHAAITPAAEAGRTATRAEPELLRFAAAGSVDDGTSSLIGRLLHERPSAPA